MSFTYSFTPGEIIKARTVLRVYPPRPVDVESARSRLCLCSAGRELKGHITAEETVIQVSTEDLSPDRYEIRINIIMDASGEPINKHSTAVAFQIGAMLGSVPEDFRVEHVVHHSIQELSMTRLRPGARAPQGMQYLELVKTAHRKTNIPATFAFDAQCQQVDGDKILAAVHERRAAKFGRIDEGLWNYLQKADENESIGVVVWPKLEHDHSDYRSPVGQRIQAAAHLENRALEAFRHPKSMVVSSIQKLGCEVQDNYNVPPVTTSLTVSQIRELAESDHVGMILFDDSSATASSSLSVSLGIARAPQVHALGFTGAAVKVAVFEDGPDDTYDLDFFDRYTPTPRHPADPGHPRWVSGIIKNLNIDGDPKGYAPDCVMYSANDTANDALLWAVLTKNCSVVNQSFSRNVTDATAYLSADDFLKDWLATNDPFPTIVQAAGNISAMPYPQYVLHKGYNTLTVGNHNETATGMDPDSLFINPVSPNNDRELPEICADGSNITVLGITRSGTSGAAPAVAGTVALIQSAARILETSPEACRAIILAGAGRNVAGSTWYDDVLYLRDASDGAGALDAEAALKIALNYHLPNDPVASIHGWGYESLASSDVGADNLATFRYFAHVPVLPVAPGTSVVLRVALAWNSKISFDTTGAPNGSVVTVDLDLLVRRRSDGTVLGFSSSFDNTYEIVDMPADLGVDYEIVVRRTTGTDLVWYGLAWCVFTGSSAV